jgi:methionyl-tRNA formyltransferase
VGQRAGAGREGQSASAVRARALKLVFAGTPDPALPSLQALLASRHEVAAVVTRPDAPAGRGRALRPSPVRVLAEEHGLEVLTPRHPREDDFQLRLREIAPDCCPVVAYGALVPRTALDIPRLGWVNLHFSLLPAWRGAAPVQHAVMAGDEVTGASTFLLEEGLDTGPVFGVVTETIRPADTAGALLDRLSVAGAGLLVATLDALEDGTVTGRPQPAEGVSLAPKVSVADARVDWSVPALRVDRLIRGTTPAPGAWTTFRDRRVKLGPVVITDEERPPGVLDGDLVGTATCAVRLGEVRPEGKGAMAAVDWLRGLRPEPGERFR